MLLLLFVRVLFKFNAAGPPLLVLLKLDPRKGKQVPLVMALSHRKSGLPRLFHFFFFADCGFKLSKYPPIMRPISFTFLDHTSY